MRAMLLRAAAAAALLAAFAPARAEESPEAPGEDKNAWPIELTKRPLTAARGLLELWLPLQLNSTGATWQPVTLNPSLVYGITSRWEIGVRNIVGLCFGGESNGCPNVYGDVGAFTRVRLGRPAGIDLAVQGGLDWVHIQEPTNWAAWGGVVLRAGGGILVVTLAPSVSFGLKDRDGIPSRVQPIAWNAGSYDLVTAEATFDNREHLSTPATLQLQLGRVLAVEVGVSLEGPLDPQSTTFANEYWIPVGAAVILTPLLSLDVGAAYTMPRLWGNNTARDVKTVSIFIALRG
jgi:hypothetical protein